MHIDVLLFFSGMASRKRLKLSSYKRSSYLRIPQKISVNHDNSADDTLTAETESDDDIDIVLVKGRLCWIFLVMYICFLYCTRRPHVAVNR